MTAMGGAADFTSPEGESATLKEAVLLPAGLVPDFVSGLHVAVRHSTLRPRLPAKGSTCYSLASSARTVNLVIPPARGLA
jgi:hypothetical protein